VRGELPQRFPVSRKQGLVRVFAGQEPQQKLVEIEPAQERFAVKQGLSADPLGARERAQFALAEPGQGERLEGEQHPAQGRARAARSPRHHRHPSEGPGECFEQQARFTIGITVQDEGLTAFLPGALSHSPSVSAQPRRLSIRRGP